MVVPMKDISKKTTCMGKVPINGLMVDFTKVTLPTIRKMGMVSIIIPMVAGSKVIGKMAYSMVMALFSTREATIKQDLANGLTANDCIGLMQNSLILP